MDINVSGDLNKGNAIFLTRVYTFLMIPLKGNFLITYYLLVITI